MACGLGPCGKLVESQLQAAKERLDISTGHKMPREARSIGSQKAEATDCGRWVRQPFSDLSFIRRLFPWHAPFAHTGEVQHGLPVEMYHARLSECAAQCPAERSCEVQDALSH